MSDKQKERLTELLQLIQENPNLPIVPMVDMEVVAGDDFAYWMGGWGKAQIDEIYIEGERIYFRSIDEDTVGNDIYDSLIDEMPSHTFATEEAEEEFNRRVDQKVAELNWKKVITVKIELPDPKIMQVYPL